MRNFEGPTLGGPACVQGGSHSKTPLDLTQGREPAVGHLPPIGVFRSAARPTGSESCFQSPLEDDGVEFLEPVNCEWRQPLTYENKVQGISLPASQPWKLTAEGLLKTDLEEVLRQKLRDFVTL